ncbi:MAG: hypothetical protein WCL14_01060 [Bacteroidota bacterium]
MKNALMIIVLSVFSAMSFAQMDTIYTNNEKIACSVKEITADAIKFSYPNEDLVNTVYKNTVQKVVMKSGRVQTFAEATSYKTVFGAEDCENVTLTSVQSEVNGLFKLGEVSAKAKGTTVLSSMEKVKERAYHKMKVVAAMMAANIVYLTQNNTTGNQMGTQFTAGKSTETNLAGVAYSNKLPNFDDFVKLIGERTQFQTFEKLVLSGSDADMSKYQSIKNLKVLRVYNESGLIMMDAKMEGNNFITFRVIHFENNGFTLVFKDRDTIYNYKIGF